MPDGWLEGDLLGFDLETTGINVFEDLPVSLSFVRYRNRSLIEAEHHLVNPGVPIPPESTAVHHITDAMVRDEGISLDDAIAICCHKLCEASAAGVPVVGMVLRFDLTIIGHQDHLRGHCGLHAPRWVGPALDVSVIDKRVDKYRPGRRTLTNLCGEYGVPLGLDQAHNSLADTSAAMEVLFAMADRHPIVGRTDLSTLTSRQAELHRAHLIDLHEHRLRQGHPGIPESEISGGWPVARLVGADA